MADAKISALTELAATPAADDELVIVDKSDTSMAASGTDKRIRADRLYSMPGNVTLGDDVSDSLTVNSGTWTLGSNYVATRTAGAVASGQSSQLDYAVTFSGHADGTTNARAWRTWLTVSGSNSLSAATGNQTNIAAATTAGTISSLFGAEFNARVDGAGAVTTATGALASVSLNSTGNAANANVVQSATSLTGAGNITSARLFYAAAPVFTSTGAITNSTGFAAGNLGHATLVTNALGFDQADFTGAASLTVGFRSLMTSGTGKWGFQHNGTANNAFAGPTRFGSVVAPTETVHVTGTLATSGIGAIGTTTSSTTTLNLPGGTTGVSSLRLAAGVAPSSPVTGDVWMTQLGTFTRTAGVTRGPHSYVLQASGAQVADPGNTTAETTYATITVPANAMGANGLLRVWTTWVMTGSTNNKTLRVKFGGTEFMTHVQATASTTFASSVTQVQNRNATNSQVGGQGAANLIPTSGAFSLITAAVDTTAAVTVLITGQTATGTETLTLERYSVEIFPST